MKFKINTFKGFMLLFAMVAFTNAAWAQSKITGQVTDAETKEALIGATIQVLGTTKGTLTDVDGNYELDVPAGAAELVFSYTGYSPQTVAIAGKKNLSVALRAGSVMDEVIVVGYGTLKSKEVSSAVASLKAEDFNQGNITNAAQLLQGKVAGVSISRPGGDPNGGFSIRLRGLSTVSANVEPLVIIDGVQGLSLNSVDPNDIASIDVLKDGSAAAIYGTRGSAGVILITTKKGTPGKTTVEYNGQVTTESIARAVQVMNTADYLAAGGKDNGEDHDYLKEVTQSGLSHTHGLALGGGTRNTTYRVAMNYRDVNGILKYSGFKQMNGRVNVTQKALNDRLTITTDLSATNRNSNFSFTEAMRYAVLTNPTNPILDATATKYGGYFQQEGFDAFNPVAIIEQNSNTGRQTNYVGAINVSYELLAGLKVGANFNQQGERKDSREYYGKKSLFRGYGTDGYASREYNNYVGRTWGYTLNYDKTFGKVGFGGLVGWEAQDNYYDGLAVSAGNFLTNVFSADNFGAAAQVKRGGASVGSYRNEWKSESIFARVNFSYDDTYFGSVSVRNDGNSRFGDNNKRGTFPAVSFGANLAKILNIASVDQLKLRLGYGQTGAIPSGSYYSKFLYNPGASFYYNGNYVPSYGPNQNSNPDLRWEVKRETNVGVDFGFMDFKLTGSLDWFNRRTTDLLYFLSVPVPPNQAPNTWVNTGELKATGVELALNYAAIKKENFSWNTGITLATGKTTLVSLNEDVKQLEVGNVGAPGLNNTPMVLVQEGEAIGNLYGPEYLGVNDNGTPKYNEEIDGVAGFDAKTDRKVIGNGLPTLVFGWNNSFTFKRFDFGFLLRGATGHDLVNTYRIFYENANLGSIQSYNRVKTKYWDEKLTVADYSSRFVENADFAKIDNMTLGYTLALPAGSAFSKVRAYITAANLATFTNYTGVDPEVRYADYGDVDNGNRLPAIANPLAPGIDRRNSYFRTRAFTFGVNVGF